MTWYWEFYKWTKTLRIRAYGHLRYAVPTNVNFSNGNNRFRVIESEVNFRRGVKKLLKVAVMISFVETTDGNIVQVCKRLLQVVISDNAIDHSLETRDTIGDTEGQAATLIQLSISFEGGIRSVFCR